MTVYIVYFKSSYHFGKATGNSGELGGVGGGDGVGDGKARRSPTKIIQYNVTTLQYLLSTAAPANC